MKLLKRLAREAVRYGLKPEEIGPASVFADDDYMANCLGTMESWETPSFYGCTAKHRERALRAWEKTIAKVKMDKDYPKSAPTPKSTIRKKAQRPANVDQRDPLLGDQELEDGFDMAVLSPKVTGLPFFVYILQDLGLISDVRVEVAHSTKGSRSETVKLAIRPTVRITSGNLKGAELALLTRWIELNRDVLLKYWDGEIESTMDAILALRLIEPA